MIRTKISWNEDSIEKDLPDDESGFYQEIAKLLPDLSIPNRLCIDCDRGDAEYHLGKRGTYTKNGVKMPSLYVTEVYNDIYGLKSSNYPDAYLTCINSESNNYKYYWLRPGPNGIGATYGRIGSERGEAFGTKDLQVPYANRLYWIRYYEKLSKGYIDQTDVYLKKDAPKTAAKKNTRGNVVTNATEASISLYKQLVAYARHVVTTTLKKADVTFAQVKKSKEYLNKMGQRKTVNGFNKQLMNLLAVCPRKTRYVNELLATSTKDFPEIIEREENLIAAMEAVVNDDEGNATQAEECFERLGIEVYYATDKQKEQVLSHLNDTLKPKVKNIYRVIPKKQQKAFNDYLKREKIGKVMQLWHGSKNSNWFSIINNGLSLNPNAPITGKMFGYGIYFAPSAAKSWNYTSYRGTYWANGNDDTAFMGLYAVAYGNPLDVHTAGNYTQRMLKNSGHDCVHAHAGVSLKNDEIIFYDESAMVLNYICEFQ